MSAPAPLSEVALRLLKTLREKKAHTPESAIVDRRLAELMHVKERCVIDAAGELLDAGHLCLATSVSEKGRFLYEGDDPAPVEAYLKTLRSRALGILRRRSAVKRAWKARRERSGAAPAQQSLPFVRGFDDAPDNRPAARRSMFDNPNF